MKLGPPSPALVVSIVALVAACAGSAYAATVITSAQIKNGTIQNQDIKKGTIQSGSLSKGLQNIVKKKSAPARRRWSPPSTSARQGPRTSRPGRCCGSRA